MPKLHVLDPSPGATRLWAVARWSAMLGVVVLLWALAWRPRPALLALWYVIIPLLPATFFLTTTLWRGICPLATLSHWGNGLGRPRDLSAGTVAVLRIAGLVLFFVLVPARHLLFNQDGPALALTVTAVGGLALLFGALFPVRSAWCNALCPVLPVELLYGQAPLVQADRGRCTSCNVCTPRGCLDLAAGKTILQVLGPTRRTGAWLATPHGSFFAALPGFVVGYNLVGDGGLRSAPGVYGTTLGWSLASAAVCAAAVHLFRIPSRVALPLLAAAAGAGYYGFAGPATAQHLGLGPAAGVAIQVAGIGLVAWWVWTLIARGARVDHGMLPAGRSRF